MIAVISPCRKCHIDDVSMNTGVLDLPRALNLPKFRYLSFHGLLRQVSVTCFAFHGRHSGNQCGTHEGGIWEKSRRSGLLEFRRSRPPAVPGIPPIFLRI